MKPTKLSKTAAGLLATLMFSSAGYAQSADALIDKLVEKGILSVKEANDLRDEADKGFSSAYQVKSGMPDWVNSLKLNGDFRGRFEGFYADNPAFVDRNRFRYRARFGVTALIKDRFEVGVRLSSSEAQGTFGGDPISGNTTLSDNASQKYVFFDRAYAKWTAYDRPFGSANLSFGKIENPFVLSDMVFDGDYNPEGAAQQFNFNLNREHSVKLNLGEFILDELSNTSNDAFLLGAQVRFDSVWNPKIQSSVGLTALAITGEEGLAGAPGAPYNGVPNMNRGNTRTPTVGGVGGDLVHSYNPVIADASFTYNLESFPMYTGMFPIRLAGEFMHNPGADNAAGSDDNNAYSLGVTFGKSGKKGLWDLSYRYKVLEADAWYEELVDSDFGAFYETAQVGGSSGYGAGTNIRGHIVKANYSPTDALTIGLTYFMTQTINESPVGSDSDMGRLQLDAVWKF